MSIATDFSASSPLALIGAGKMGGALVAGWLNNGLDPLAVQVFDPAPPAESVEFLMRARVAIKPAPEAGTQAAVIVVAVKPQIIKTVLPTLRPLVGPKTIGVSIAAGTTLATLEEGLGPIALVRAMPNTPAQVGRGVTAAVANRLVDVPGKALVGALLDSVGASVWVEDEALIDAVTAVSGSGPAYVFLLIEHLAAAGVAAGLPEDLALRLARATVSGAGELAHRASESAEQLRKNVTSPGGTTAAALEVLMAPDGLAPLMTRAIAAASRRSRELAG